MQTELHRLNDTELYELVTLGGSEGERAFVELYNRFSPRIYKYCVRILGNQRQAEDIFQETFVKFYQSAVAGRTMTNLSGYIFRIARNLCLNGKESKYDGLLTLDDLTLDDRRLGGNDRSYEHTELLEILRSAVECLPIDYREAFVLREYDGLSYREIADILEVSVATVKIRIFRAKQGIRKVLSPYLTDLAL
jgi:RNA polymerase sigma-70 factor (ECF subfamily)